MVPQSGEGAQASDRRGRAALLIGGGRSRPAPAAAPRPEFPREIWASGALRPAARAELETPREPPRALLPAPSPPRVPVLQQPQRSLLTHSIPC